MSFESVRAWVAENAPDLEILEMSASTATVAEAAETLGVEPARIAKTLAVRVRDEVFLLVTRGDARLDNQKTKREFGGRPRMLGPEETLELTGHPVGGVPVRAGKPPARLRRPLDQAVRRGLSRRRRSQRIGSRDAGAAVRSGGRSLGGCVPAAKRVRGRLGAEALADDLAALGQTDALNDLVVVGQDQAALVLVPERAEEVEQVAGEQRG